MTYSGRFSRLLFTYTDGQRRQFPEPVEMRTTESPAAGWWLSCGDGCDRFVSAARVREIEGDPITPEGPPSE